MKGKILSIIPSLQDSPDWETELIQVQIGLGEPTLAGVRKGTFKVGEVVELPYQLLGRDGDGILIEMASELYRLGTSDCERVDCPELEKARMHPINYRLHNDDGSIEAGYLKKIWDLMSQLGKFDVRPNFVYYFPDPPDLDQGLWGLVGLGYLVSEYNWRVSHEAAAQAEYKARENRLSGVRAAAAVRRGQGRDTASVVRQMASLVLEAEPDLRANNSKLAERVQQRIDEQREEYNWHSEFSVSLQWIRKLISRLKKTGQL